MKYGVGSWTKIIESGCLPGKNRAQLNLQTQRLLGQQSLGGNFLFLNSKKPAIWVIITTLESLHSLLFLDTFSFEFRIYGNSTGSRRSLFVQSEKNWSHSKKWMHY
jgi:hypothetical protein